MTDYTKTTDFAAKDSLPSGDSGKIIKGTEFETEFDNIATAIATKSNIASPTFTGTTTIPTVDINGGAIDAVTLGTNSAVTEAQVDNININGNAIISTNTNGNIDLTPNGTGEVNISKVDIDSGAIDGTVIGAASAAAITGTTITGTSFVTSGDLTLTGAAYNAVWDSSDNALEFADNAKATFGNAVGGDLQIYHGGSHSFISEQGTGNLKILADSLVMKNAADTQNYITGTSGGAAALYYAGSEKLATTSTGIDVTGTVTADGLTVSNSSLQVKLEEADGTYNPRLVTYFDSSGTHLQHTWSSLADGLFLEHGGSEGSGTKAIGIQNGDISFYEDTGTTAKLFWDASAESLSIGTTTAGRKLQVYGGTTGATDSRNFRIADSGGTTGNRYDFSLENTGALAINNGTSDIPLVKFHNNSDFSLGNASGTTKLFWDASAESLGIGTTSPASALELEGVGNATNITLDNTTATTGRSYSIRSGNTGNLDFYDNDATNARVTINSSGNVGIGTSSPNYPLHVKGTTNILKLETSSDGRTQLGGYDSSDNTNFLIGSTDSTNAEFWNYKNGYLRFATNSTERMRIDSSGKVFIGKTSDNDNTAGHTLHQSGLVVHTRDQAFTTIFNRTTNDGDIVQFKQDGALVGSISVTASATAYNTSSDQRLKENIVDAPSASDDIDAIQVRSFDWKADGSHQKYGMVAQELVTVAPEAVSQPEDPEEMMGVDYSKLVPMLIKEVQQLRARVAQLEGAN